MAVSALRATAANKAVAAGCAVYIHMHPHPRTISESREVLRVLESYGEVVMFRNLKYEPTPARNRALAIYRSAEAADRAMRASPMRFVFGQVGNVTELGNTSAFSLVARPVLLEHEARVSMVKAQTRIETSNEVRMEELAEPVNNNEVGEAIDTEAMKRNRVGEVGISSLQSPTPPPIPTLHSSPETASRSLLEDSTRPYVASDTLLSSSQIEPEHDESPSMREVSLSIFPSNLNHSVYISRQHYYGNWHPNKSSIAVADLLPRVPMTGLSDLRLDMHEVPVRIRAKRNMQNDADPGYVGLRNLKQLWHKGMKQRGQQVPDMVGNLHDTNTSRAGVVIEESK